MWGVPFNHCPATLGLFFFCPFLRHFVHPRAIAGSSLSVYWDIFCFLGKESTTYLHISVFGDYSFRETLDSLWILSYWYFFIYKCREDVTEGRQHAEPHLEEYHGGCARMCHPGLLRCISIDRYKQICHSVRCVFTFVCFHWFRPSSFSFYVFARFKQKEK